MVEVKVIETKHVKSTNQLVNLFTRLHGNHEFSLSKATLACIIYMLKLEGELRNIYII